MVPIGLAISACQTCYQIDEALIELLYWGHTCPTEAMGSLNINVSVAGSPLLSREAWKTMIAVVQSPVYRVWSAEYEVQKTAESSDHTAICRSTPSYYN